MSEQIVAEVISDLEFEEERHFRQTIKDKLTNMANIQKEINRLNHRLQKEKESFKELTLEATDYAKLLV